MRSGVTVVGEFLTAGCGRAEIGFHRVPRHFTCLNIGDAILCVVNFDACPFRIDLVCAAAES